MRRKTFGAVLAMTLAFGGEAIGQTPVSTAIPTFIDIGNIRAPHYPVGDMWWTPEKNLLSGLEYPKGDTVQVTGLGSVMFGGRDASGMLRVAGNFYRDPGTDFQPGPIVATDPTAAAKSAADWTKIWKINSSDIDIFLANRATGNPAVPQTILEWPGKGNPFAKGNGGVSLTLSRDFAPFVDVNGDSVYNPYDGDYPRMKGSQMLWWMFNDFTTHALTRTAPIEAEISASAYAYSTGTLASNIIFYEYEILNRGAALNDFHFGLCSDVDVSYPFSDFVGTDSVRRLGIMYNGTLDSIGPRGNPAFGALLVEQPGDSYTLKTPLRNVGNFDIWFQNGTTMYNYLSTPQWPVIPWNVGRDWECRIVRPPGDRRFLISSGARSLPMNARSKYAFAMFMADSAMACPRAYFGSSIATADTAFERYWHPARVTPASNPAGIRGAIAKTLQIYPSPAQGSVFIDGNFSGGSEIRIINALGATVNAPVTNDGNRLQLDVSTLPAGIYHALIRDGSSGFSGSFVKD